MADSQVSTEIHSPINQTAREKKTRELPNLSDCRCCNRRINNTNPKERLRILTSEWRIVLLCKQCYKLVESAQLCSYCLRDDGRTARASPAAVEEDLFFQCPRCERRIHKDCVSNYSMFAPWSFLSGTVIADSHRSFICIDCWMPKLLGNRSRRRVCRDNTKGRMKVSSESCSLESSRVSDFPEMHKSLEDVANEANHVAHEKIVVAVESMDKALKKAVAARRAVELASGALDLVAKEGEKNRVIAAEGSSVIVDDAQLAFQLHRAINSSRRIANNLCLLNTSGLNVPKVLGQNGNSSLGSTIGGLDSTSPNDVDVLQSQAGIETSTSSSKLRNIGGDDNSMDAESHSCLKENRLQLNEAEQRCREKCDPKCDLMRDEKCNGKPNRYLRKYSRRR
ncbi:hypothetical protein Nepgr_012231 [Nepenthes gracilis]|uniref:Uncharacterized protein n=1 Tax=Nepenthes gracilis TaxID=150966 RepID=A0AAD3SGK1_NEPGR|nr:hypothetical protein Nepgr_012231 [Nepenthes gracilis]